MSTVNEETANICHGKFDSQPDRVAETPKGMQCASYANAFKGKRERRKEREG